MKQHLSWPTQHRKLLIIILLLSILLRLAAAFFLGDQVEILPGIYDQVSYHKLALRVLNGHGFTFGEPSWPLTRADAPTAHWSYLYTFYLLVVYTFLGPHPLAARLIQAILVGLLQPILAYLLARRLFGSVVGLSAAALTSVYVYFIYYAAALMTESFYITAVLGTLYLAIMMVDQAAEPDPRLSRNTTFALAIGLGLAFGIAVLLRQLFLLIIPFLFVWIWWASRQRGGHWTIPALLVSAFLILVLILPFTLDNYTRFERFALLNTNAGYAFFWANHPIYGTQFEPILPEEMGSYQSLIPMELRRLDEAALDQELLKRGVQFVIADPGRYLMLSLSRIPVYFKFWPSPNSSTMSNLSRLASFGLLFPFMLYGLFLAVRNKHHNLDHQILQAEQSSSTFQPSNFQPSNLQLSNFSNPTFQPSNPLSPVSFITSPIFLLILFTSIYTLIHLLSWALIRYRLPVDAVLLIFAGIAVVDLFQRVVAPRQVTRVQIRSTQTQ